MLRKERYKAFIDYFSKHQPDAETELNYRNPYQLLVAVILSAQCTDKRINQVTPRLFDRFPNPESLAKSTSEEVFEYIRSVSYPNNKAKHLVGMAQKVMSEFNGEIPSTVPELIRLPGVGRKTANVIVSVVHRAPAMAVDTHVFRVANRLGLTINARTPLAAEKQLVEHLPKDKIFVAHHWLILHGRYICLARNPKCGHCPINWFCKYYEQQPSLSGLNSGQKHKLPEKAVMAKNKTNNKSKRIPKKLSIKQ